MIQSLLDTKETTSLPEMCARLGEVLGLQKPVPLAALLRAIDDPAFAADLLICRNTPGFLAALFDDRRTRAYAPAATGPQLSSLALASKAAAALARWGKAGFSTVDDATLQRRETACLACPNLATPRSAVQRIAASAAEDRVGRRLGEKICALCGCVVAKKIRLPTESCPDAHPTLAHTTRWGEPARDPESLEGSPHG